MTRSWPELKGGLLIGAEAECYGTDFGGIVETRPHAVVRAADVEDVVSTVSYARTSRKRVVARGQGHTTRGQSHGDDVIVIDLRGLDAIDAPRDTTVRVGAGARWTDVVVRAAASGLAPPVLTDYLDLTVGGTLAVGGVGGQSFRHGFQVDNVIELEVVDGRGELVRCSATEERHLFDACRGGLGEFGIVVAATLRLVPAPREVHVRRVPSDTLDEFLSAQLALSRAGTFDYLLGNLLPPTGGAWHLSIECVDYVTEAGSRSSDPLGVIGRDAPVLEALSFVGWATRLAAMADSWRASGSWQHCHPWIDLFVPAATAAEVITVALDGLDAEGLGDGHVMTYPLLAGPLRAPCPGVPDCEELFLFDVLPSIPRESEAGRVAAERRCHAIFEAGLRAGATVYPIGFPIGTKAMRPDVWRRQLARHRVDLGAARRHHDPDGVIGAGLIDLG
jgi:cytokinin dehydrogenase